MTTKKPTFTPAETPAILTPAFVQDRELSTVAGAPKGYRRADALNHYRTKSFLAGGRCICGQAPRDCFCVKLRAQLWEDYETLFMTAQESGTDSTQGLNVSHSRGSKTFPDGPQSDAMNKLIALDSNMKEEDRLIIRNVCGLGFWPSEAIREVCGDYQDVIPARMREALNALHAASESVRRKPKVVRMAR